MITDIIRVFPRRTSYTPTDDMTFVGMPPLIIPDHKEVHVSCTFSWDLDLCRELQFQWQGRTKKPVYLGGPALCSPAEDFVQGMYIRENIIFTSRGCNNNCPWCFVPKIEHGLKELPICAGNWIQDNNFLQTSRQHKDKVFEMLKTQKRICFKGGLESDLVDDHFVQGIRDLRIEELWLACDTDAKLPYLQKACSMLTAAGFNREKLKCYVLSFGKNREKDEARARSVYEAGAMPFVQLFREYSQTKTEYSSDWNAWARMWQRPAAIRAHMERGTDYKDFTT